MEVTLNQFRRHLFQLVERALEGEPLIVKYRGHRIRFAPEPRTHPGLEALTPLQIVNPIAPELNDPTWKEEMLREWQSDWAELPHQPQDR